MSDAPKHGNEEQGGVVGLQMRPVIARKFFPAYSPHVRLVVWYLFLDRLQVPSWIWGVAGTLAVLYMATFLVHWAKEEEREVSLGGPVKDHK